MRCLESASVQRYLDGVRLRTRQRWIVPPGIAPNAEVSLRFALDAAGLATSMEAVGGANPGLAESAVQALRSASPFPPMNDANRCLTDKRILLTFSVPSP